MGYSAGGGAFVRRDGPRRRRERLMDTMRSTQQIEKIYQTAPRGPMKIPAMALGNAKEDIAVVALLPPLIVRGRLDQPDRLRMEG